MSSGADGAGPFAQGGGHDRHTMAAGLPFDAREFRCEWSEERFARLGDAAAEDDEIEGF